MIILQTKKILLLMGVLTMFRVYWVDKKLHGQDYSCLEFDNMAEAILESMEKVEHGYLSCWVEEDGQVLK
jgi:hypothetical protein